MTNENLLEKDPTFDFMIKSSDEELLFLKALLIKESQFIANGFFLGDLFFGNNEPTFTISKLSRLIKAGFIKISIDFSTLGYGYCVPNENFVDCRYCEEIENCEDYQNYKDYEDVEKFIENYDEKQGLQYNKIIKDSNDYKNIILRYEIVDRKKMELFLEEKLKILQEDVIYNSFGERFSKYDPQIIKLNYVSYPFQTQINKMNELLSKYKENYIKLIIKKQKKINPFAVLLTLEKIGKIKIINLWSDKNNLLNVEMAMPEKLDNDKYRKNTFSKTKIKRIKNKQKLYFDENNSCVIIGKHKIQLKVHGNEY